MLNLVLRGPPKKPPRRPGAKPLGRQRPPGPSRNIWIGLAVVGMIAAAGVFLYVAQVEESRVAPAARFEFEGNTGIPLANVTYRYGASPDNVTEPVWSSAAQIGGSLLILTDLEIGAHYYFEFAKVGYYRQYQYFRDVTETHGPENERRIIVLNRISSSAGVSVEYTNGTPISGEYMDAGEWVPSTDVLYVDAFASDNWDDDDASLEKFQQEQNCSFLYHDGGWTMSSDIVGVSEFSTSDSGNKNLGADDGSTFDVESGYTQSGTYGYLIFREDWEDSDWVDEPFWNLHTPSHDHPGDNIWTPTITGGWGPTSNALVMSTSAQGSRSVDLWTYIDTNGSEYVTLRMYMRTLEEVGATSVDVYIEVNIVDENGVHNVATIESTGGAWFTYDLSTYSGDFVLHVMSRVRTGYASMVGLVAIDDIEVWGSSSHFNQTHRATVDLVIPPSVEFPTSEFYVEMEYWFNTSIGGSSSFGVWEYPKHDTTVKPRLNECGYLDLGATVPLVSKFHVTVDDVANLTSYVLLHLRVDGDVAFEMYVDYVQFLFPVNVGLNFTSSIAAGHLTDAVFNVSYSTNASAWLDSSVGIWDYVSSTWINLTSVNYTAGTVELSLLGFDVEYFGGDDEVSLQFVFLPTDSFNFTVTGATVTVNYTSLVSFDITVTVMNNDVDGILYDPITVTEAPWIGGGYHGFLVIELEETGAVNVTFAVGAVTVFGGEILMLESRKGVVSLPMIASQESLRLVVEVPTGGRCSVYVVPSGQVIPPDEALISTDILESW